MKKIKKYIFLILVLLVFSTIGFSCTKDGPDDSSSPKDSTILIYAVATNSLKYNLFQDKDEILEAAKYINLSKNNVLIYQIQYEYDYDKEKFLDTPVVSLVKLAKSGEKYVWETIKEYDLETESLNPKRISEVVNYVTSKYPAKTYGMMFWSHSTGSQPFLTGRSEGDTEVGDIPAAYSFGQDLTSENPAFEHINIDELADALPDALFEYIWFDSCYMSNIESIYQMRNKCNYYVGYATEVCDAGNPYHLMLPYLTSSNPDLVGAATVFFNYYDKEYYYRIGTIAITDMSKIGMLADFCKLVYKEGNTVTSTSDLHKYTRGSSGPFYDLGDYTKAMANLSEIELEANEWDEVLDQVVIYKAATPNDFSGKSIDPERYSGISTHIYNFNTASDSEKYYQSLDWFKTVFTED